MWQRARQMGEDLMRSMIGALNLGLPILYTMETWWLAWRLPIWVLALFAFGGVAAIVVVTDLVGFERKQSGRIHSWRVLGREMVELLVSAFVAAYAVLLLFGILEFGDPPHQVLRHGLIHVVPLGVGAAIANKVFKAADEEEERQDVPSFGKEMATFALGAGFFAFSIAPTEEIELMAAHAGWWRLIAVVLTSLAFTHLVLYRVAFRGRSGRLAGMASPWLRWGETAAGYVVALAVSAFLLFGYGHLVGVPLAEAVQHVVTLSLVAAFGGAAARVVV